MRDRLSLKLIAVRLSTSLDEAGGMFCVVIGNYNQFWRGSLRGK